MEYSLLHDDAPSTCSFFNFGERGKQKKKSCKKKLNVNPGENVFPKAFSVGKFESINKEISDVQFFYHQIFGPMTFPLPVGLM